MDSTDLEREAAVFDFVERFRADAARDDVQPLEEYLKRFPGHEGAIAREYVLLEADLDGRTPPTTASLTHSPLPDDPGLLAAAGGQVGPFRVVRELGRGGQGTVFLAEDAELDRRVALKVIRTPLRGLPSGRLERLRREVQIVAHLDHPNICAVYQADVEGDPPWVAMRYVEGETLAQIVHRRRRELGVSHTGSIATSSLSSSRSAAGIDVFQSPTDVPAGPGDVPELHRVLRVVEGAARALHAAHEAGVVHRDVKPANIMVDTRGEPVLLDFGLARQTDDDLNALTRADDVFGTPAYMSPEQIRSENADIDARTDVYSLGMALYECLTLRRPYRARSRHELEEKILGEKPPDPGKWNSLATGDVRTVLDASLAKDRDERYASALEFAEDLRRIRMYEPIQARAASTWSRLVHWVRRQPRLAAAIGSLVLSLAIGLTVALVLLARVRDERDRSSAQNLAGIAIALTEDDPAHALIVAIEAATRGGGYHATNALYAALGSCELERRIPGLAPVAHLNDAALAPDGSTVAAALRNGSVMVFAVETGALERTVSTVEKGVHAVDYSPDSAWIASGAEDGVLTVFAPLGAEEPRTLRGHEGAIRGVAFSPDGALVATASDDGRARVWDFESGRTLHELVGHTSAVEGVRFSPAGDALLTWGLRHEDTERRSDHDLRVWDVATGELRAKLVGHGSFVRRAIWSPDGRLIASASRDASARLWDPRDGTCLRVLEHPAKVHGVAFSPDGARLVTAFDPGDLTRVDSSGVRIWRVSDGELERELVGHEHRAVSFAAYSANGSLLATCGYDGSVRVWDPESGTLLRTIVGGAVRHEELMWTPDGRRIITFDPGVGRINQWILAGRPGQLVLRGHEGAVTDGAFLPDGRRCATASVDGTVGIWDTLTGVRTRSFEGHRGAVVALAVDPGGEAVASASVDHTARVWPLDGGTARVLEGHEAEVNGIAFSPDGERILTWSEDGTARLFDAASGAPLAVLRGHGGPLVTAAFSRDGALVATGGNDRSARLFDGHDGAPHAVLDVWSDAPATLFHRVFALEFTADGERLLTACEDLHVRAFGLPDGALLGEWPYPWTIGGLRSRARGSGVIARAQWGTVVRLLQLEPDQSVGTVGNGTHLGRITEFDISSDDEWVVTASLDGTVRLWRADSIDPLARIGGHEGPVLQVRFSPDDSAILSVSTDGTARIWPTDPLTLARSRMPYEPSPDYVDRLVSGSAVR